MKNLTWVCVVSWAFLGCAVSRDGISTDFGRFDASSDVGVDSSVDSSDASSVDSSVDVGVDASSDVGVDSRVDVGVDSGMDVTCSAPPQCRGVEVVGGLCSYFDVPDGDPCDDGDDSHLCSSSDRCDMGACVPAITCPIPAGPVSPRAPSQADYFDATGGPDGLAAGVLVETCPDGWVVVGFAGTIIRSISGTGTISGVAAVCGQLLAVGSGTSYEIRQVASTTLATLGESAGEPYVASCPPNGVVIGLDFGAGWLIDGFTLQCAQLRVDESSTGFTISRGPPEVGGSAGGSGGGPQTLRCPTVATGISARVGRVEGWPAVEGIGIQCDTLTLD